MEHAKAIMNKKSESKAFLANDELTIHQNVLQVVDTTLLKCYLEVSRIFKFFGDNCLDYHG